MRPRQSNKELLVVVALQRIRLVDSLNIMKTLVSFFKDVPFYVPLCTAYE